MPLPVTAGLRPYTSWLLTRLAVRSSQAENVWGRHLVKQGPGVEQTDSNRSRGTERVKQRLESKDQVTQREWGTDRVKQRLGGHTVSSLDGRGTDGGP
jgi:hypothetical protein